MANFERQLEIFGPYASIHPVTFIGLGGIGSGTAYSIRKMGFSRFHLWDYNTEDSGILHPHNVPSQHYDECDVGKPKVVGIERQLRAALDTPCDITSHQELFTSSQTLEGIVIAGVDNMHARKEIWKSVLRSRAFVPLYIDGRIAVEWNEEKEKVAGEWIEIFTLVPSRLSDREFYDPEYLFSDDEATPERCTAQAVAYIGSLIAGHIGAIVRQWNAKELYPRHFLYDCLTRNTILQYADNERN